MPPVTRETTTPKSVKESKNLSDILSLFCGKCLCSKKVTSTKSQISTRTVSSKSLPASKSLSTGSVYRLMSELLLKIHVISSGSQLQSRSDLKEKALSLTSSVLKLLSKELGIPIKEEADDGFTPLETMVEAIYQDLLEKESAKKLHQTTVQHKDHVSGVIDSSAIGGVSSEECMAAPYQLLSSVLHPGLQRKVSRKF